MRPGRIEKASNPRRALVRLAMYLSPYKWTLALVVLFVLIYILLGLMEPYLIGRSIDQFISTGQINGLAQQALLLLVVYLLDNTFQAASAWLIHRLF
jgi:ATP-binding cassette subfamily B protein